MIIVPTTDDSFFSNDRQPEPVLRLSAGAAESFGTGGGQVVSPSFANRYAANNFVVKIDVYLTVFLRRLSSVRSDDADSYA